MICGMIDTFHSHLKFIEQVLGRAKGAEHFAAMNLLMLPGRNLFVCDTYVNELPSAEQLADMTIRPRPRSSASASCRRLRCCRTRTSAARRRRRRAGWAKPAS